MADGFEVKVPITIKGGREGEKAGKQIGAKIAEQLKKAFRGVGITRPATGGGGGAETLAAAGMGKSLKGIAGKLGIIALAVTAAIGVLSKSSPYLKGILSIFGRAFMIFFRPFGDFLATLLRPLAILLMKMAVAFLKWTRTPAGKATAKVAEEGIKAAGGIVGLPPPIGLAGGLNKVLGPLLDRLKKFPGWLWGKLTSIWSWTENFGGWIWEKITSVWNYVEDFGVFLWGKLTSTWNYISDFGSFLWGKLKTVWNYFYNFGSWLWGRLKSIWSWHWDFGKWLWNKVTEAFGNIGRFFFGGYQAGTPFVPETGLYKLHRGEQVIPRSKTQSRTVIFRPSFQISGTGISKDIDIDAIVRRAGRITEMELKKRGIL